MNREVSAAKASHVRGNKSDPHAPVGTFGPNSDPFVQLAYLADRPTAHGAAASDLLALVEGLLPVAPEWVRNEINLRLVALSHTAEIPHRPRLDVSAWCSILQGLDRAISNGPCGYVNLKEETPHD